jgi:hypothetical protein
LLGWNINGVSKMDDLGFGSFGKGRTTLVALKGNPCAVRFSEMRKLATVLTFTLGGCASQSGGVNQFQAMLGITDPGSSAARVGGCAVGALAAGLAAKAFAVAEAKRQKLSAAEASKRERGYILGFAMLGCGGGSDLAGTAYSRLSEAGKQARQRELIEAASSAKVRTYADPENPSLRGQIKPGAAYAESGNRECRDVEDLLADAGKGEPAVVKMCRLLPNGGFAPVMG